MVASSPKSTALQDNFGVEYVIRYKFEGKGKSRRLLAGVPDTNAPSLQTNLKPSKVFEALPNH